jgi:hypothetical protein
MIYFIPREFGVIRKNTRIHNSLAFYTFHKAAYIVFSPNREYPLADEQGEL